MRIVWFEDGKEFRGHEYLCINVDRDLTKCSAYIRVTGNDYQALVKVRKAGWGVNMGDAQCPDHLPNVTKIIRKGK